MRDYSDPLPAGMMSALSGGSLPVKATHIKVLRSRLIGRQREERYCAISITLANGHHVRQQRCLHTTNYLKLCIVSGTPSDETCGSASSCNVGELP